MRVDARRACFHIIHPITRRPLVLLVLLQSMSSDHTLNSLGNTWVNPWQRDNRPFVAMKAVDDKAAFHAAEVGVVCILNWFTHGNGNAAGAHGGERRDGGAGQA